MRTLLPLFLRSFRRVRAVQAPDPDQPGHAAAVFGERVLLGLVGQEGPRLHRRQEEGRCSDSAEVVATCTSCSCTRSTRVMVYYVYYLAHKHTRLIGPNL